MRLVSVDSDTTRPFQTDIEQIVLGDHTLAVADQVVDEVEDLRLDRDQRARSAQLAAVRIEHEVFELKEQSSSQSPRREAVAATR